jgi:hypothetical protein
LTALRHKVGLGPASGRSGSSATSTPKRASGTRGGKKATTPSSSSHKSAQKKTAFEDDDSCDSDSTLPDIKDVMANTPSKFKRKPFRDPPAMPVDLSSSPLSIKRSHTLEAEDSESTPRGNVKTEKLYKIEDNEDTPSAKRTKFVRDSLRNIFVKDKGSMLIPLKVSGPRNPYEFYPMNPSMEDVPDEEFGV